MPKTTLGVHVTPLRITSVRLKSAWKGAMVDCVLESPLENEIDALENALRGLAPFAKDSLVSALGADALFQRIVELPFTDQTRVERTAPLEAEDSLPLPLERMMLQTQILGKANGRSRALILATPTERLAQRVDSFRAALLPLAVVDAEPLALATVALFALPSPPVNVWLLDLDGEVSQGALIDANGLASRFFTFAANASSPLFVEEAARQLALLREQSQAPSQVYLSGRDALDADLDTWRSALGLPVDFLPYPKKALGAPPRGTPPWPSWAIPAGLALREVMPRRGVSKLNLLKRPSGGKAEVSLKKRLVLLAVFGAVLLALWGVGFALEDMQKRQRLEALKASIREMYATQFPNAKSVVDEVEQMRQGVAEMEERAKNLGTLGDAQLSPVNALRELSTRIPSEIKVEFREFVVEEDRIRIDGETTSFDAIDKIKLRLAQTPGFVSVAVSDAKAGVDAGKVLFKMTIQLGKTAAPAQGGQP